MVRVSAEAAGDRRGLLSPLSLKSPWDTGVRPPQPADREDESAPLKDVPQSSLTAETCLKVHGFPLTTANGNVWLARRRICVIL